MAPSFVRACVASVLALLTTPRSFGNEISATPPPPQPPSTTTTSTAWRCNAAAAFIPAPHSRHSSAKDDLSRRFSDPRQRRLRRHHSAATTTPPGGFSVARDARLKSGATAASAGGPLTRLSVSASLADRSERRAGGAANRPSSPPPGAVADALGSTGPRDLSAAPVEAIDSMDMYFKVLEANADSIVVVKVFAGFCRACKAFDRKYRLLALEYEEAGANIKFFEMDWMQTRDLCKSLQVKKLPHLELYAGERGRLESFVCGPSKAGLLKEKLDALLADPSDPSLGNAPPPLIPAPPSPT